MPSPEQTGAYAVSRPLSITGRVDLTAAEAGAGYASAQTGEAVTTRTARPPSPYRDKRVAPPSLRPPETRAALRAAWEDARAAANALVQAIEDDEPQARFIAADDVDKALSRLWALRSSRDDVWKMILNHAQGMLRQLFQGKLVEAMTKAQGAAVRDIVEQRLGPATKSKDDLTEAIRLIEDAGCDPYHALSGEPDAE